MTSQASQAPYCASSLEWLARAIDTGLSSPNSALMGTILSSILLGNMPIVQLLSTLVRTSAGTRKQAMLDVCADAMHTVDHEHEG